MRLLLAMSWRNLWRHRRRTLISISAAGIGLALVIFYIGFAEGLAHEAKTQLDNTGMGHVEVYAAGWRPRRPVEVGLERPAALLEKLPLPAGAEAGARVVARALASSAHGAQGVTLLGVDPAAEARLSAHFVDVRAGEKLRADDERGVLVGEKLAERLKLQVGRKLRVMVQGSDGEMSADVFRVRGIFHSMAAPISRSTVFVTAPAARRLLGIGDVSHQLVVQIEDAAGAEPLAATLRARLGPGAEVVTYADLLPALRSIEELFGKVILGVTLFVYVLVGLGILNIMSMSVLERTREFGVMRALGEKPRGVVALVLAESFWIAFLSVAIGTAIGLAFIWTGSRVTLLDFSKGIGESYEVGGTVLSSAIRTAFVPLEALRASALVFVLTLLVGIFPARRVARMEPARALRAS